MATGKIAAAEKPKISRVEVYWHTVRYRTVVLVVLAVLDAVGVEKGSIFGRR